MDSVTGTIRSEGQDTLSPCRQGGFASKSFLNNGACQRGTAPIQSKAKPALLRFRCVSSLLNKAFRIKTPPDSKFSDPAALLRTRMV